MKSKYPVNGFGSGKTSDKPHLWLEARPMYVKEFGKWQCTSKVSFLAGSGNTPIQAYVNFVRMQEDHLS